MITAVSRSPPRRIFMLSFALIVAALVLTGFKGTLSNLVVARNALTEPWFVYVHGALLLTWILLLVSQAALVADHRVALHRRLGQIAVVLIPLTSVFALVTILWSAAHHYRESRSDDVIVSLFGELMSIVMFSAFAGAALLLRRRPIWHKRLALFATLAIMNAAVGRISMLSEVTDYVVAALLLSIVAYDFLREGKLQPITGVMGSILLGVNFTADFVGSTTPWMTFGTWLLHLNQG